MDAIASAANAGYDEYLECGEQWMRELEIAYLLACLRRPNYDNNEQARLRRHVMLYAERGIGKSSIAARFLKVYASSQSVGDLNAMPEQAVSKAPHVLNLGGQGISWERMRGSATMAGDVIVPLLQVSNFYFASELMSFLRSGEEKQERMDVLNEILEEGKVTVALVKMAGANISQRQDILDLLTKLSVKYNPNVGIMSYNVQGSAVACSRPFDERTRIMMEDSGMISRFVVSEIHPTDKLVRSLNRHLEAAPTASNLDNIRAFNAKAWSTTVQKVLFPPSSFMRRLGDVMDKSYERIETDFGLPAIKVRSMRDVIDIAQLLTAKAYARTLDQTKSYFIPEIKYDDSDVNWAIKIIENRAMVNYDNWIGRVAREGSYDQDTEILNRFKEYIGQNGKGPVRFDGTALIKFMTSGQVYQLNKAAAYDKLSRMVNRGWIKQVEIGRYELEV